jgi:hypothetical protein
LKLRSRGLSPAEYRLRAPLRSARAARDRPVPPSRRPNILILSNASDGEPQSADAGSYFHTDYCTRRLARAMMLYSIEVPTVGGNTLFATSTRRTTICRTR